MKNTIISSVVAILCVVALCVTYAVTTSKSVPSDNSTDNASATPESISAAKESADYMTEAEAAAYIGVTDEVMKMIREKLGYFKGAYMSYTYTNADGDEVTDIVYKKDALNEAVEKMMNEYGALNFRYIQNPAQ